MKNWLREKVFPVVWGQEVVRPPSPRRTMVPTTVIRASLQLFRLDSISFRFFCLPGPHPHLTTVPTPVFHSHQSSLSLSFPRWGRRTEHHFAQSYNRYLLEEDGGSTVAGESQNGSERFNPGWKKMFGINFLWQGNKLIRYVCSELIGKCLMGFNCVGED